MPTVYIVNKGGHDYSPAEEFGDLVFLTEGVLEPMAVSQMYREIKEKLKNSQPEDYILLTSLTVTCTVAAAIFAVKHNRVNFLLFSKGNRYVERTLVLDKD